MDLLLLTAIALGVTSLLTPALIAIAPKFGMVDHPAHRKIHRAPVPYMGGLGISLGLVAALASWHVLYRESNVNVFKVWSVVLFSLLAMLLGLIDDKFEMRARRKLFFQVVIAAIFAIFVGRFEGFTLPGIPYVSLSYFSVPITVFWIVAVINAVNLIDGVDGLAGTVSICSLCALFFVARMLGDFSVQVIVSAGAGAVLGFLFYNFKPARIYMGDAGSHGLGMLVAGALLVLARNPEGISLSTTKLLGLSENGSEPYPYQALTCTLVIAYPALEIVLSVARRLMRGKSIGSADRNHIHHTLLQKDWSAPAICLMAASFQILFAAIVLSIHAQNRGLTTWLVAAAGIILGIGLNYCGYIHTFLPSRLRDTRPHFLIANHFISMQKLKLELAENRNEIVSLVNQTAVEFEVRRYFIFLSAQEDVGDDWKMEWSRPLDAHSSILPFHSETLSATEKEGLKDSYSNAESGVSAEWIFESHAVEHDIDVEYRVLMNEFMRKALERAEKFRLVSSASDSAAGSSVTSGLLKRRAQGRMANSAEAIPRDAQPVSSDNHSSRRRQS